MAYIEGAGIAKDSKGLLFRTIGRSTGGALTRTAMEQAEAHLMIERHRTAAGMRAADRTSYAALRPCAGHPASRAIESRLHRGADYTYWRVP